MKFSLLPVQYRLERVKKAFKDREDSQQISARTAKLVTDIGSGKLKPTEAVAKGVALYLRRQSHVYGDQAFEQSINEITAFLAETGEIEGLIGNYKPQQSNTIDSEVLNDPKKLAALYLDSGPYGLIQIIESLSNIHSRAQKASKLLEFGKILKTQLGKVGIRTQLAEIALALDKTETTLRGVCWSMINDEHAEQALVPFAYLYFYHEERPDETNIYFDALMAEMVKRFNQQYLDNYLQKNKESYEHQVTKNLIEQYRSKLILSDKSKQESLFTELLIKIGTQGVIEFIDTDTRLNNKAKALLALRAVKSAKIKLHDAADYTATIDKLADYAFSKDTSEGTLRNVYFSYQKIHSYEKAASVLKLLEHLAGNEPTQKQRNLLWSAPSHLLTLVDQVPVRNEITVYQPVANKVCYVIHNSLPYSSGGYATRGHGLLTGLKAQNVDIYALTRPGYPHDISQIKPEDINQQDEIDGVVYKRLLSPSRRDYSNYEYMLKAAESYKQAFIKDKPALIVAASNHLDGLPAMFAARELGIPFIYEIRGFWEITRLSKYPLFKYDPMFEVEKQLEAVVARNADHVFTLTQGMIDELQARDVDTEGKITLLPNSCNVERFNPAERDEQLSLELDIPLNVPVIGYVGTLVSYEGLDDLATACGRLKQLGYDFRLLIVGNENATGQGKGSITTQVQEIATKENYADWVIMPGRVPFEEVERYYSLIDIAPFPRKAWPVCEMVPPMKTLEALSMKKAVLVSSNKALTEMITHDVNGRVYERGNVEDLTQQLKFLLDHPETWSRYGEQGRLFVENERTWQRTAEKAAYIINKIINQI